MTRMCGRYRLSRRTQIIAEHFDASPFVDDWIPRYNIAPTQARSDHPPRTARVFADALGINSILGERHLRLRKND